MGKKCLLVSKLNYPVMIKYNGNNLMIAPKAQKVVIEDDTKLGELPQGIIKIYN